MAPSVQINGIDRTLEGVDANTTLLNFVRGLGLTGTKEGCAEGECGACAMVWISTTQGRAQFEPINSCLVLAHATQGRQVWTAEGLARGDTLHPVQQAMIDAGGSQCGYCTPGFVISLFAEYYRAGRDGYDPESISGNLCRCTGYRPIRDVAQALGTPAEDDPFVTTLAAYEPNAAASADAGAPGPKFVQPTSLSELFDALDKGPSRLVAGGTDVVVEMNQNHVRHPRIVAIDRVEELRAVKLSKDEVEIGAGVPLAELERTLAEVPMFEELFPLFSSRLIRNRATLGGNLVNASPIGDSPPVLLALGAELVLARRGGTRRVALDGFFTAYRKTILEDGEIVRSVVIPRPFPTDTRFYKVSKRVMDDISTVAAAFAIDRSGGVVTAARLAYGGVAATPARAHDAEQALIGSPWNGATVSHVCKVLRKTFTPMTDHRGSADYRAAMVERLFQKFHSELSIPMAPAD
ncbi:MAG: FAD binding domain-containing protein [Myxococcota bacterium]